MRYALLSLALAGAAASAAPAMETPLYSLASDDWSCSPEQQPVSADTASSDAFYSLLQTATAKPDWPGVPRFEGHHDYLCDTNQQQQAWEYCLPVSASLDENKCTGADRIDLLHSFTASKPMCQASVLHLLLLDVYAELERLGGHPALVFGTLLGAVRDGGIIPFTEDADVAYRDDKDPLPLLQRRLRSKGYHVFHDGIWRVCVAPTHPLAAKVYDPELAAPVEPFSGPYLDLYRLERDSEVAGHWNLQHSRRLNASIPEDQVLPFSKVTLNGVDLDTLADPAAFLVAEYGTTYLVPVHVVRWNPAAFVRPSFLHALVLGAR